MPTALTPVAGRTAITVPIGADPVQLTTLVSAYQAIANRSEWNKEDMIVASVWAPNIDPGLSMSDGSTWETLDNSDPTEVTLSVSENDIVLLFLSGEVGFSAVDEWFKVRFYDGTNTITSITYDKQAAWTVAETYPINMTGVYVASATASVTFSLQGLRAGASLTASFGTYTKFAYVHIKKGAA